jgi:lipopolysaccharide transport system permease protein
MHDEAQSWTVSPHRQSFIKQLPDLWVRRSLFPFFIRRAIVDLYAQTILGVLWLVIRPLIMVIAATLVIGTVLGVSTRPVPQLLFSLMSFAPWIVFQRGLIFGTKSIRRNQRMMRQFYFPRVIMHVASAGPALVQGLIVFACALIAMAYFVLVTHTWEMSLGWYTLLIFPSVALIVVLVLAITMVTSVLNSYARDIQYSIRYVSTLLMIITPVFYPLSAVPEDFQFYMQLNPLTPILEMFRWAVFHVHEPNWSYLALSICSIFLATVFALWFFIRWEASALDQRS